MIFLQKSQANSRIKNPPVPPPCKPEMFPYLFCGSLTYSFEKTLKAGNQNVSVQLTESYPFGFNGMEKNDEMHGNVGDNYDYGMRAYDVRLCRFMSVDPLMKKFPYWSPYQFAGDNPIMLVDNNGENPIDPRTGKPFDLNLYRAAVIYNEIDKTKTKVVKDKNLYDQVNGWWDRSRDKPDGAYEGGAYHGHDSNAQWTSSGATKTLQTLFPGSNAPGDYGAPNDEEWRTAATVGTYVFTDDKYAESEVFRVNSLSYSIFKVEENYITEIVNLTRPNDNSKFNVASVTTFNIVKSEEKTREMMPNLMPGVKEHYRTLTITETTTEYKDNKPTGKTTTKTYTKDEIITH